MNLNKHDNCVHQCHQYADLAASHVAVKKKEDLFNIFVSENCDLETTFGQTNLFSKKRRDGGDPVQPGGMAGLPGNLHLLKR